VSVVKHPRAIGLANLDQFSAVTGDVELGLQIEQHSDLDHAMRSFCP
jgi:hypothetical protein